MLGPDRSGRSDRLRGRRYANADPGKARDRRACKAWLRDARRQRPGVVPVKIVDGSSLSPGPMVDDTDIFWM
jgi:hypothetical protein